MADLQKKRMDTARKLRLDQEAAKRMLQFYLNSRVPENKKKTMVIVIDPRKQKGKGNGQQSTKASAQE